MNIVEVITLIPGAFFTKAIGLSMSNSCGIGTTAAAITAGCFSKISSNSLGET